MIALLGNLAVDVVAGGLPRIGGAPFHAARALRHLEVPARIYARCAVDDRDALLPQVVRLGTPVEYVLGRATARFEIDYEGDRRVMRLGALGDAWLPADLPALPAEVGWVHVAPLARQDFPPETLAAAGRGRWLSLDGQGLVRTGRIGDLELDDRYDLELLRHVSVLKLSEEEAEVLGDPATLPVRELIVTHGSRGATVHVEGSASFVPASALARDPTGAGDAFCISYVAARSTGLDPEAAARRATSVVATVLAEPA